MKKQILFLTFFVLAIIAGVNKSYGQNLTTLPAYCVAAPDMTANCVTGVGPLAPIAGQPYQYTVTVPTPTTGNFVYNWFVTTDQTFITNGAVVATPEAVGGAHLAAVDAGLGGTYNDTDGTGGGQPTINLTWNNFTDDPANPVFLVIYVENSDLCVTQNLEAFIIKPQFAFTLAIDNIKPDGTTYGSDPLSDCVSSIVDASWNTSTERIDVDYGENYVYFVVNAANFYHSWQPIFQLTGASSTNGAVQNVDWAYPATAHDDGATPDWNSTTEASGIFTSANPVTAQVGTSVGETGECIIVRVHLDHNQDEVIVAQNLSLAVNGTMYDAVNGNYADNTLDDIDDASCNQTDYDDAANFTILPRPDINESTPSPFVDKDRN